MRAWSFLAMPVPWSITRITARSPSLSLDADTLILLAVGYSVMPLVIMCVAGVIIGLLLLVWEYFDRWDYRRLGQ